MPTRLKPLPELTIRNADRADPGLHRRPYVHVAYHELRSIDADREHLLECRSAGRFLAGQIAGPPKGANAMFPTHTLLIEGTNYSTAETATMVPGAKCATIIWFGGAQAIDRPSNSRVIVIDDTAYAIATWTDIYGHSRHRKACDMKFQENKRLKIHLREMSPHHSELVIQAISKVIVDAHR